MINKLIYKFKRGILPFFAIILVILILITIVNLAVDYFIFRCIVVAILIICLIILAGEVRDDNRK